MGFLSGLTVIPLGHLLSDISSFALVDLCQTPLLTSLISLLFSVVYSGQDDAIVQSEQLFATFMDNLPSFVWIKDLEGRYLYVNEHVKRLEPYQNGWLGKTDSEIWPSEIAATFRENDLRVAASREHLETVELCHFEGRELWVLVNKFPIFDSQGRLVMVGGAGVDITERKRTEKALRETEEKYRSIFEKAIEGIFQTTPDGRFITANPALARMLGFDSPEELIKTRTDIAQEHYVDPASRNEFKRLLDENGFILDLEFEVYRKDGSKIWISENVLAVRDQSGRVLYYEGTTQDITARKRAEEALRESEERYRDLVENSRELICTHDLDGLILSANRAAMETLGHISGSYEGGMNLRNILAPEVRNQFDEYLARIRAHGVAKGLMLVQTRTGERRVWEYHNTLRTQGVSAPIVRGMARDITERRRANDSLRLFRALIDQSRDAIEVIDPNTLRFLDCNESAHKALGYSREEFLSLSVCDVVPQFDERMAAWVTEEIDRSGFVMFEGIHQGKDESIFPVEINLTTVRLEKDYRLAVVRDITERKKADEALHQAQSRIESILNSVADSHILFDREWRCLYVNEAAVRAIGRPREQILGHTLWKLYPDIVGTELDRQYHRAMNERIPVAFEFYYPTLNTWWENRFYPAPEGLAVFATDITERKVAEEALRNAERKYRDIFENAIEGIFQIKPGGGYISANPALARMLGFSSPDELMHERSDASQIRFVDVGRHEEYARLLAEQGFVRDFEYEDYRKDGSTIWLSDNVHAVRDSEGTLLYYEGTTQDVTARKHAEQALRESEERYRELFENAKDATYVHDLSGRYISVNRAAEKLTGYTRAEILGQRFSNFVPAEQLENIHEQLCRKLVAEGGTSYESEVMTKDGRRVAVEVNSHLIYENGAAVGVQGTARDITERKATAEALFRLASIAEQSNDAIIGKTLEGVVTSWNKGAERIYGYEAGEIVGHPISVLMPTKQHDELPEILVRIGRGESIEQYETIRIRKDGHCIPVSLSISPIKDANGKIVGASTIARDITEHKAAEDKLKATSEQMRALSVRLQSAREEEGTRIAREIHDELGAALTSLKWDLEEIEKLLSTSHDPSALEVARHKLQTPIKLTDLAITAVRRIASELRPSVLDDLGLAAAIEWQAQQFEMRTGIVCVCDCSLEQIELNEAQSTAAFRISQEALTNVLRHAQATRVDIKIKEENGYFVLRISDNGKGITEKEKSQQKSLGILGMRERAHLIGGKIEIRGVPAKGTMVTVRVPIPSEDKVLKMTL